MKVFWTERSRSHLREIYHYIAKDSVQAATKTVDRLTSRSIQIGAFPRSGRMVPQFRDDAIREVIERPYRIIYRITEIQIDVLAVVHSARNSVMGE